MRLLDREPTTSSMIEVLRLAWHRGRAGDRTARWLEADHVVTIRDTPELSTTLSNYITLCNSCHARKTLRESVMEARG